MSKNNNDQGKDMFFRFYYTFLVQHGLQNRILSCLREKFKITVVNVVGKEKLVMIEEDEEKSSAT